MKSLSTGGRLTLCKSVLGSLGVFLFSLFKAPAKVLDKLERLRKYFFWGAKDGCRKIAWVAWDKVLNNKDHGGLGIGSLKAQNLALLARWWWRFKVEDGTLWKGVITAIHGQSGGLGETSGGPRWGGAWRNIANINLAMDPFDISLPSLFNRKLGNGRKINFWEDVWC